MSVTISNVEDSTAEAWDGFVAAASDASLYHRYAWRDFYREVFGKETFYLAATGSDGDVQGVLPLVRQKSRLFGDYLASLPFFNYGGVLAGDDATRAALYREAGELGARLGVDHVEIRESASVADWPARTEKVAMLLELPDDEEALSSQLGSKLRSQIRRPQREDPTVTSGGIECLDDFYAVFARNMRDLGTPVYSRRMFAEILERFPDAAEIVAISVGDEPAAAAFLLHANGRTEIPWASANRAFNRISINMLLYWEVLRRAIARESTVFDFGRSTKDSGTFRFKRQWGAEPQPLYWYYWLPDGGELPGLTTDSGKYDMAIKLWQKLPLPIANRLGPSIVQHLP